GLGAGAEQIEGGASGVSYPAVTISIGKRPGTDAMAIASQVETKLEALKGSLVPSEVTVSITRNYGETAAKKVASLLEHLLA
ncbi:MAG TPA: hypothetical protein DEG32_17300, partial [Balneolaceae bacterium]|nr:hypothetical protein [Balneolaceae bacterium]